MQNTRAICEARAAAAVTSAAEGVQLRTTNNGIRAAMTVGHVLARYVLEVRA
jgi:hypothetical protein